eukprot:TRINITY_DN58751_c0_g1_i1.p1 TRINITY_DN58751_c0_g1~~TRINITY_DN58751_c0_g1_i1.p1  ORF type:complete len:504 (+),score=54.08 TRINITY_DN58751_c0_g1_i1:121-1512(+)
MVAPQRPPQIPPQKQLTLSKCKVRATCNGFKSYDDVHDDGCDAPLPCLPEDFLLSWSSRQNAAFREAKANRSNIIIGPHNVTVVDTMLPTRHVPIDHGQPTLFVHLCGHARTLLVNIPHFVQVFSAASPNWVVSVVIWDEIDTGLTNTTMSWWQAPGTQWTSHWLYVKLPTDMRSYAARVMDAFGGRAAVRVVKSMPLDRHTGQPILWVLAHELATDLAARVGILPHANDVVLKSRPDILIAVRFTAAPLAALFQANPRRMLVMSHYLNSETPDYQGRWDPLEVLFMTSWMGYKELTEHILRQMPHVSFASILMQDPTKSVSFMREEFRIHFHRMSGDVKYVFPCRSVAVPLWENLTKADLLCNVSRLPHVDLAARGFCVEKVCWHMNLTVDHKPRALCCSGATASHALCQGVNFTDWFHSLWGYSFLLNPTSRAEIFSPTPLITQSPESCIFSPPPVFLPAP